MKPQLFLASVFLGLALSGFAAPAHVIIRVPAGSPQPPALVPLLAQWREAGQVGTVLLLTRGRAENPQNPERKPQFETFVLLEFPSDRSAEAWQRDAVPKLPAGLIVRRADALAHGEIGHADALNVLEYRDSAALAALVAMKSGLRERLTATVPTYASFDKIKESLRVDGYGTTATYTELTSPEISARPSPKE